MSDPMHRHPYDCIAFLDQRWDAMTAEMRAKAVQVEAELHMRIAALTSELAEARGERDSLAETRAALTANLNALTVDVATMRAERDEARRALAECERERDALRSGTWAGAWKPVTGRPWSDHAWERHHPHGAAVLVCYDGEWRLMRRGVYVDFKTLAKESGADAAKAAADAHLIAAGWWLAGGAHKAGEAK